MTPRPSDQAREALRAARRRANDEPEDTGTPDRHPAPVPDPGPDTGGHGRSAGREQRPGDVARDALRRAVLARRAAGAGRSEATGPADAAGEEGTEAEAGDGGADTTAPSTTGSPRNRPTTSDRPLAPDPSDRAGRRPGDIAREALRSAREEAQRARPETADRETADRETDDRETDDRETGARESGARRAGHRAGSTPSGTTSRVPRTTRGDRAESARTSERVASGGAHQVRELLTGAFPAPPDADEPGPEPDGTRHEPPAPPAPQASSAPPASPPSHAPRSMAAPARDGELRRTFPAFPPDTSDGPGFAETWWGDAWVTALEKGALDAARLARGRRYAQRGHVDAVTVTPGLVLAYVQGSRPRPYRVQVRLRTFGDADWERFLDTAADRPGHIAALLEKELPQSLADCGVPLLPSPGDLEPRCSCPDSGHPCKHAAALCYQTARLLDADPFVLLLLRGRGERQVIDALSRRSAARAARAARGREQEPLPGVRAGEAVAPRHLPPLPAPLPPPPHPEQPPVYPASPGGPDPFALDQLATDAAARAHTLLTTGRDPVGRLTLWQDAVRLAAARPGSGLTAATRALYSSLARAAGRTPAELARAVAAWHQGGPTGLEVLEDPWDPPAGRFDRARPLLLAADLPAFRPWRNHLTHPRGHVQIRLGRDHLWYAYESEPGHDDWWPRGTPDPDPVGALTGLDAP
ncbi:SWIM zinc finger family protein [Streptomyces sp. M2CJ-2]|uniref:SWIM zinc finger family protein n=1 Tax=Streptomyces sp. M2CJ-2 TaxID=2803948 RepID=UPI001925B610|nr:SWIM zinc finger family protein [Streptomyces sp. M2CJ-2]MBL3667727.1 SWIM zinc finger family protein [Streptomyces sp. M2CJ-2]